MLKNSFFIFLLSICVFQLNCQLYPLKFINRSILFNTFACSVDSRSIDLSNYALENIDPMTFEGLNQTEYIYLENNKLTKIDPNLFKDLTSLREIWLETNEIISLNKDAFKGLNNLEKICLNNNPIASIYSSLELNKICGPNPKCKVITNTKCDLSVKVKSIKLDCQHDSCLRPQDFNEQLKEQINLLGNIKNDSSNLQSYLSVVFDQLKEHEKLLDFLRNDSSNLQKDNLVVYDQLKEHRGLLGDLKNDSSSLQEEILKAKVCSNSTCKNDGICNLINITAQTYECKCVNGYYGPNCEAKLIESTILRDRQGFYLENVTLALFNLTQFTPKSMRLIYRATRDGWSAYYFHKRCDEIPNTLTLIKTTGFVQDIFGGFTSQTWGGEGGKPDPYAFLISLSNSNNKPFRINKNRTDQNGITSFKHIGPKFGIKDIYINDNSNEKNNNTAIPSKAYGFANDSFVKGGYFQVSEIEVFQILALDFDF